MPPKKQLPKGPAPKGPSFDEIIQSDRQKKHNELLASQILGKNKNKKERRASAPGSGSGALSRAQPPNKPGSLASRIAPPGNLKRSASASFRTSQPQSQPQHKTKAKTNLTPATVGAARSREKTMPRKKNQKELPHSERLLSLAQSARDANPQAKSKPAKSGLSIKGASGPFIVVGSNFSPGTSAADIQAALEARTGPMLSCRVISNSPAVTAEIAYVEKEIAENTVANFDNQWADGRQLAFRLNVGGDTTHVNTQNSFNNLREQADRDRRNRRAEPQLQDGRYGFDVEGEAVRYNLPQSNLYSDRMVVDTQQNSQSRARRH